MLEHGLALCTNDAVDHFTLGVDEDDCGDAAYAELHGQFFVFLDVALADVNASVVLGGQFLDDGSHTFAGTAPCGPEVNDQRLATLYKFLEVLTCDVL